MMTVTFISILIAQYANRAFALPYYVGLFMVCLTLAHFV